jgi:hypothetical protein
MLNFHVLVRKADPAHGLLWLRRGRSGHFKFLYWLLLVASFIFQFFIPLQYLLFNICHRFPSANRLHLTNWIHRLIYPLKSLISRPNHLLDLEPHPPKFNHIIHTNFNAVLMIFYFVVYRVNLDIMPFVLYILQCNHLPSLLHMLFSVLLFNC